MIDSFIFAGLFIGCKISGILHYHDRAVIPSPVSADRAYLFVCQCKAFLTVTNIFLCLQDRFCQTLHLVFRHVNQMKSQALCRFGTNARKPGQFIY